MTSQEFVNQLKKDIQAFPKIRIKHPFLKAVCNGTATMDQIRAWAIQDYQFRAAVPRICMLRYLACTDPEIAKKLWGVVEEETRELDRAFRHRFAPPCTARATPTHGVLTTARLAPSAARAQHSELAHRERRPHPTGRPSHNHWRTAPHVDHQDGLARFIREAVTDGDVRAHASPSATDFTRGVGRGRG